MYGATMGSAGFPTCGLRNFPVSRPTGVWHGNRRGPEVGKRALRPMETKTNPGHFCPGSCKTCHVPRGRLTALTGADIGMRHGIEMGLGLFGQAGEHHRDIVAAVFVAGAGDDDAGAMQLFAVAGGLERNRHLRPFLERRRTAEFDSVLMDDHGIG